MFEKSTSQNNGFFLHMLETIGKHKNVICYKCRLFFHKFYESKILKIIVFILIHVNFLTFFLIYSISPICMETIGKCKIKINEKRNTIKPMSLYLTYV